ncbi:DBIRD complex subunit ZNF326 isoform X1 [Lates calcarifer]|uniref:DBIRD complex subunit ZNF326 n=1 Tax=Lates calcarifer TaxID=8187 RepID=A0AAJ7PMQ4_LATCA|nr:DBIRD complex subunit ZNF326 isoform X1 [Lates calcarifer]
MNRQTNVPFSSSTIGAAPVYKQLPGRVPKDFIEAMKRLPVKPADSSNFRTADMAVKTLPTRKRAAPSTSKWKSSFKPVGDEDDDSQDKSATGSEKAELYDPYDPGSSDSELEMGHSKEKSSHLSSGQDNNQGRKRSRWDCEPGSQLLERRDFSAETRPGENRGLGSGHRMPERQAYSSDTESLDRPAYGSRSRPLDHRVCSPDRIVHISSTQQFPASYGGQKTNGITVVEHRRETTTSVRLSPPKIQRDYQHQSGFAETALDQIKPATEVARKRNKTVIMDSSPITCDLCDVELANGQELEDHLDSNSHWATLEHIQQRNNYDDMAIAFLQEVMLYKSRQCSRAIEDCALQALQENDHMTKVEMFHCAACSVFVSTSASSVQTHITSQEHLSNTKEFEVQQKRNCLSKAETIMKELRPQFEHFMKGDSPFE